MIRQVLRPQADQSAAYRRRLSWAIGLSVALHVAVVGLYPARDFHLPPLRAVPVPLRLEESSPAPTTSVLPLQPGGAAPLHHAPNRVRPARQPAPPAAVTRLPVEPEDEAVEFWMLEKQPVVLTRVLPAYPDSARRALVEGRVFVRVLLDRQGHVERVGEMTGPAMLRAAAAAAARQWRFAPAVQNNQTVRVWLSLPFSFRLE